MHTQVVLVTVPDESKGREIARAVVTSKLAACVNVIPRLHSIYFWDGKLQEDAEALLLIKTSKAKLKALETKLAELHPYSVPEFVVLESSYTSEKYWSWLAQYLDAP